MADPHDDPAMETRLSEYLAGELRRAEDDYPRMHLVRRSAARRRPLTRVALFAVVAALVVLFAGALVVPRLVGPSIGGPAAVTMGDDGLPTSIGGEPVRRLDDTASWVTGRSDDLVGGTLLLNTGPCLEGTARAKLGCGEDWTLVSGTPNDPRTKVTLSVTPDATPGFVRTSGALTVIRIGSPSTVDEVIEVARVVWRQPTKGPIPDNATPAEGGMMNEALVPDFVPMVDRDGVTIAGYVPKRYAIGAPDITPGTPSDPPQALPVPVYGEDLVTLVGHDVPGVGFVALGATETPSPFDVSEAPATAAPVSVSPSGVPEATAPLPATPNPAEPGPALDCGNIDPVACARAVDLARSVDQGEIAAGTSRVVVGDTCPPESMCDRKYPFDSYVVFVTAGADTTGWITFEATGLADQPTAAARVQGDLPAFMASRVAASTASTNVFRFDVMNRSSKPIVVAATSDAGAARPGFLPGQEGSVYVELGSRSSLVDVQLLGPACTRFASVSYSVGYGETVLTDDDPTGQGLILSFDPGMFTAPVPLPVNAVRCPGG